MFYKAVWDLYYKSINILIIKGNYILHTPQLEKLGQNYAPHHFKEMRSYIFIK
jgi:hypothetical protein